MVRINIKFAASILLLFQILLSKHLLSDEFLIQKVQIYSGECELAYVGNDDFTSSCQGTLTLLFLQDERVVFSFELGQGDGLSFISEVGQLNSSKIKIINSSAKSEMLKSSGECLISSSFFNLEEVDCSASLGETPVRIRMSSLKQL